MTRWLVLFGFLLAACSNSVPSDLKSGGSDSGSPDSAGDDDGGDSDGGSDPDSMATPDEVDDDTMVQRDARSVRVLRPQADEVSEWQAAAHRDDLPRSRLSRAAVGAVGARLAYVAACSSSQRVAECDVVRVK